MSQEVTNGLQRWWPILLGLAVLLVISSSLFQRWNTETLVSHPNPVKNYAEAVERIQAIQAGETDLNPLCVTRFMTHGEQTERVIVLVHGYTNCPQQFAELGKRFYDLGYNVLIVPLPGHGLADRLTDAQGKLKAEDFTAYADQVVDIAQGLGRRVAISGISLGGVICAWAVQNRSDVDFAMIISPGFSFQGVPNWLRAPIENIFVNLPATYEWWDPVLKEDGSPPYTYPRYSKHTLGEAMRLGLAVQAQAERAAPQGKAILIVTNGNDPSVDNLVTQEVGRIWRAHGATVDTYEFDAGLRLGHDLIDPNDKGGNIELVYPRLIALVNQR